MTDIDATRDEWLAWRREGIGASDVAGILGLSPWASPWSIWADKTGLLPPEPENEHMAAGRWLEAAIGPWFTHETGLHVAGEQTWCSHPVATLARCTVDGFVTEAEPAVNFAALWQYRFAEALGLLEIKVTGPGKRWDEVPAHYQAQAQWQMFVTGLERVWFAVLMGRRLDIHELARDQADIDYMRDRVERFWHDHVLTGTPPPTDGHDATLRALGAAYADPVEGAEVEVSGIQVKAWLEMKEAVREDRYEEKEHAAAIQASLGEAEIGTVDGRPAVTWRQQTRKTTCRACGHVDESEPFRVLRPVKQKENA